VGPEIGREEIERARAETARAIRLAAEATARVTQTVEHWRQFWGAAEERPILLWQPCARPAE
jgi:hypothetical protein